ncbi:MAG: methyltransferase domain-containing protein [Candidatus Omnitrophica bacterium]|nr:methyltransferase domain-containing protein [Candidatus Omnitrophota bacterium]
MKNYNKNKGIKFSDVARYYEETSLVQNEAGAILFDLVDVQPHDCVLDLGCGPGHLTAKIAQRTTRKVLGYDRSEGMVRKAQEKYGGERMEFYLRDVEEMTDQERFGLIFCNSAFHWFKDSKKALAYCYRSLKKNGRIGIQAPGSRDYSPQFIRAVNSIRNNPKTREIFRHFRSPWVFFDCAEDYQKLFESVGFNVHYCEIRTLRAVYSLDKIYDIFCSGAAVGYLNHQHYNVPIDEQYPRDVLAVFKQSIQEQAEGQDCLTLCFNRIYLLAIK